MKIEQMNATSVRTEIGTTPAVVGLSNNPCNVTITVQMDSYPPIKVTLEDENECRNLIARMAPSAIIQSNPTEVLTHITGDLDPMYDLLVSTGKSMGLALPTGV